MMVTPVVMVVVMVPRTIAADPARAVIGPDGAAEAARPVIIVGIVGRLITIKARTEMVVMMMPEHHRCGKVRAAVMIEAAAAVNGVHAAAVKGWAEAVNGRASQVDAAANASEMSATSKMAAASTAPSDMAAASSAVAASTPATTAAVSAMDFGDQRRGVFRDRRRSRIDRRKCFCALHSRHHQHRSGRDAKRLRQTVPEIWNGHHG